MPINLPNPDSSTNEEIFTLPEVDVNTDTASTVNKVVTDDSSNIKGLTQAELADATKIKVSIIDKETPIIVLYGPPACGKTMTLVRMTRFLRNKGYQVEPEHSFRESEDTHYAELCNSFNDIIESDTAAKGTNRISFMLVKVYNNGKPVCQILEAPGEHYFDKKDAKEPNKSYLPYIQKIMNLNKTRKIWSIFVTPNIPNEKERNLTQAQRNNYVAKINKLNLAKAKNKFLFVYNKVDGTQLINASGGVKVKDAVKEVQNFYPGIFEKFKNRHPISRWWREYDCDLVPFQTGTFNVPDDGGELIFEPGDDNYCENLWNKWSNFL